MQVGRTYPVLADISQLYIYIYLESSFHADTPSCPFLSSRALLEILLPGIVRKNVIHQGLGFGRRILDQFSSNTLFPNTSFRVNFNSKRRRNESNGWSILEITSFADFYLFFKFLFQIFLSRCFYLFISLVSLSLSAKFHLDPVDNRCPPPRPPFYRIFSPTRKFPRTSAFSSHLIILSLFFPPPPFSPTNPFNPSNSNSLSITRHQFWFPSSYVPIYDQERII